MTPLLQQAVGPGGILDRMAYYHNWHATQSLRVPTQMPREHVAKREAQLLGIVDCLIVERSRSLRAGELVFGTRRPILDERSVGPEIRTLPRVESRARSRALVRTAGRSR